jgi:O-antigen/teichoic acid export membrane protein
LIIKNKVIFYFSKKIENNVSLNKNYLLSFFAVAGGTLFAQIITFLSSPIISRLYSPTSFGYFSTYTATISILTVLSCARYELAIPLPKDINDSIDIFKTAVNISLIISIIFIPIIFVTSFFLNEPIFVIFLYSFIILISGLGLCLNLLHNKLGNFRFSSISKILQASSISILGIIFSTFSNSNGLIISSFLGQLIVIIYLLYKLPVTIKKNIFQFSFNVIKFKNILFKYAEFPKISLIPSLLNIFSSQIPNYLIASIYGAGFAGFYFFSARLVVLPTSLVGSALNDVYYQKIIEKINNGERVMPFLRNNTLFLFLTGLIFFISIFFLSEKLIPFFFGKEWSDSIVICKILSISMVFKLVVSPLTMTFIALNKMKTSAFMQYFYFAGSVLICFVVFHLNIPFIDSLKIFIGFDCLTYSLTLLFIFIAIKKHDLNLFQFEKQV